jgi:hypothetical protein
MSTAGVRSEHIAQALVKAGLLDTADGVREIHIDLVAGEVATMTVVRYADPLLGDMGRLFRAAEVTNKTIDPESFAADLEDRLSRKHVTAPKGKLVDVGSQPETPVSYWVLADHGLMAIFKAHPERLPLCLTYLGQSEPAPAHPGMAWELFQDTEAPRELDGERIQLILRTGRDGGGRQRDFVTERRVIRETAPMPWSRTYE